MRVELYASHEIEENINNEVTVCQDGVEYLHDFAEILLQFTRSVGYTYVKQVILVKDDKEEVMTVR